MKKGTRKWIDFNFEATAGSNTNKESPNEARPQAITNNTHSDTQKISNPLISFDSKKKIDFNFVDKLKPKTVEDLAVHPKKIKEVEAWFQQNVISGNKILTPILLLTGPTGCGKTATINVLCSIMHIKISEWINPTDQESEFNFTQAQVGRFLDFFTQSKYVSLYENNQKKIVLIEDFPNFVVHNPTEFCGVLEKCSMGSAPVVFICTDANNSKLDLSRTLFPQEIQDKYQIANINFNPCSNTLLKAALRRAQNLGQSYPDLFKPVAADIVDAIICTSVGDIRCALNQYQFSSLKGVCEIPTSSTTNNLTKSRGAKRKRNEKSSSSILAMSKDETLGFFHGLGRVLNPKRMETGRIQCDFNALIDQFSTQPSIFNSFLQENYIKYFGNLNDVQNAADVLSQAQIFLEKWSERNDVLVYALWVSVLGLMVFNEHKVSRWNQIKAPTKIKRITNSNLETRSLKKDDYIYYNKITNTSKFHTFKI